MKKLKIDYVEYKGMVQSICRDISASGWMPDYIVGITRGGLLPAVMISQYFDIPCQTLKISLRENDELGPESNLWMAEEAYGYRGELGEPAAKNILVVDDINDTGATLNWLMEDWRSGCLPNDERWNHVWGHNVRFAVIVDNLASQCKAEMNYVGLEINKSEDDVWIEFPYEEWWAK
jgi:hypoxanthine phosphoribosyltransferase